MKTTKIFKDSELFAYSVPASLVLVLLVLVIDVSSNSAQAWNQGMTGLRNIYLMLSPLAILASFAYVKEDKESISKSTAVKMVSAYLLGFVAIIILPAFLVYRVYKEFV